MGIDELIQGDGDDKHEVSEDSNDSEELLDDERQYFDWTLRDLTCFLL